MMHDIFFVILFIIKNMKGMKFQVHSPCGTRDIQQQRRRGVGGGGKFTPPQPE